MTTIITERSAESRRLRAQREAVGLTQRQVAVAAGCSLSTVANVEAGCVPSRSEAIGRIRAALDAAEREAAP
jgi:predicted transcriptional regulator